MVCVQISMSVQLIVICVPGVTAATHPVVFIASVQLVIASTQTQAHVKVLFTFCLHIY